MMQSEVETKPSNEFATPIISKELTALELEELTDEELAAVKGAAMPYDCSW